MLSGTSYIYDREQNLHCFSIPDSRTLVTVCWIFLLNLGVWYRMVFTAQQIFKLLFREKHDQIKISNCFNPDFYTTAEFCVSMLHIYMLINTQDTDSHQYHKDCTDVINSFSREVKDSKEVFWIPLYLTRGMKRAFGKIYMLYLGFHRLGRGK